MRLGWVEAGAILVALVGCAPPPVRADQPMPQAPPSAVPPPPPPPAAPATPPPAPPPAPTPEAPPPRAYLASLDRDLLVRSRPMWDERFLIGVIGVRQPVPLAGERPIPREEGEPCEGGWYRVNPRGFVCASGRVTTDPSHPVFAVAPELAPQLEGYAYHYGKALGSPRYRRIPSTEEQRLHERDLAPADPSDPPPSAAIRSFLAARKGPLRHRHATYPGMKLAWSQRFRAAGRSWLFTTRGFLVPADRVEVAARIGHRHFDLDAQPLPFAVALDEAPVFEVRGHPVETDRLAAGTVVPLAAEEVGWRGGRALWPLPDGRHLGGRLAVFRLRPRPARIDAGSKWVHVSVNRGALVAYEGERPVFAALASPGIGGTNDNLDFDTPPGLYAVQAKWTTSDMRGELVGGGQWATPRVPWVAYYYGSYAIHGAWWHDRFGRPQSHGCVNLSPEDARWLFGWLEPALPAGWRAVRALPGAPGTPVYVTP